MSNIRSNFPTLILWMIFCLSVHTTLVLCDEKAAELSPETDNKNLADTTKSKVEESAQELKSKDGDTLDASPSQHSPHTDYNYVVSKESSPISIDLGPHSSVQTSGQDQQISTQYESQSNGGQQPPSSIVYRYTPSADINTEEQQTQQQSFMRQEPQHQIQSLYEPKSYVRQALLGSNIPESLTSQSPSAGYRVPELPMKPGVSTTYYSPNVKIVSHTRSFLPVVYNKPTDESSDGSGQSSNDEQEYDKAVQDRPGGNSFSQQQGQGDSNYDSNSQSDDQGEQSGPAQESYEKSNDYRNEEQDRNPEVLSRGPYYNIHKPHVAHIQVIEEKNEYNPKKEEYGGLPSYGYRTQPRPQYKNYQPSGYKPGMIESYDPPSPSLASLLPALSNQSPRGNEPESDDDDESYNNREQSGNSQHIPEAQPLQQLSQSPHEYTQRPGVEVEFDQSQKNEPNVVRGPGVPYRPQNNYNEGPNHADQQGGNDDQDYNQGQERPNDYESGNRGQEFINNNQLGPKYNVENDEPEQEGYKRGRPQQTQQLKPKEIEYGFIPLSEAKTMAEGFRRPEGYRGGPMRPNRPNERPEGYGPEGYRSQRGYGDNGGEIRRPQFNGPKEGLGLMFGRGQQEGHRGGGYNGNDIYRDSPVQSAPSGLGPYRKPAFERPGFGKGGEGNAFMTPYGNVPKGEEEEEQESDEQDYGKHKQTKTPTDNKEDDEGPSDPNKLPYICYPWNCNPWHAIHPDSPYNSGIPLRGQHSGSGLPPGASYNPRDVGLDEAVVAQLNLAASSPPGIVPHGMRPQPQMERPFSPNQQFPAFNAPGMPSQRPQQMSQPMPNRPMPFSASGQGFRSQYGYRAAASEVSPVSAAQTSHNSANSPVLSNLLNLNPVKSFRSLMSYLTGGLNE